MQSSSPYPRFISEQVANLSRPQLTLTS
uniref:Uncharacterized protein n=1 Tax=Anguilla anguilla TaxID=7936 RepID=A0A0E9S864_ANGAN